jgi:polyferredoxin
MPEPSKSRTIILFLALVTFTLTLSITSNRLWGGKSESLPRLTELKIDNEMTVGYFGQVNSLSNPVLKEIFDLKSASDLKNRISDYGKPEQIKIRVTKKMAIAAEHGSKNWIKILIKFSLWFAFLITLYILLKKYKVTSNLRKLLLLISILIFGIVTGSDPSPMGTVKDAIHLFGSTGAIFPPRMIALMVFLLIVFLANKYICAWGCQVGTLQDLIFRINRTDNLKAIMGKQIKVPFILSNSIRVIFTVCFTIVAFIWGMDIIEPIDPFKIYRPAYLGIAGIIFVGILLIMSLFVYRPWCHFFCPFGLVGWFVEKISRIRISIDYKTCIACRKCSAACPSTVMEAILKRNSKVIPDCFSCYTCREVCPTGSISFSRRKRTLPPAGHFE